MEQLISETKQKMEKAVEHLKQELASVRTGRANPALIEQVKVEVYGSTMVLRDLASINAPEPRLLVVQPWDKNNTDMIVKAIRESGSSLNPAEDGDVIRVPIPQLNEERRRELIKLVHEKTEGARVAIRVTRRDAMEKIEKDEKRGKISKDDRHRHQESVQKVTDEATKKIDDILKSKEAELSQV
jgi:ribosome recycling factor